MSPKVAVIILNWKQPEITSKTVDSFLKINPPDFDFHLYIINNNTSDESYTFLSSKYFRNPKVSIHNTGANLGYAQGNNFGLKLASQQKYQYYLLSNNDILVKPDFLEILLKQAKKLPQAGMVGPKIYFAPGYEYHHSRYTKSEIGKVIWSAGGSIDWKNIESSNIGIDQVDNGQFSQIIQPDFLSGCCLLISQKVIETVGLLDKNYFMYLEDVDYSLKVKQAGFKIYFVPDSVIWHMNSGSSKPGSDIHNYFLTRNRLIFALKYASFRIKLAVLKQSLFVLLTDPSIWRRRAVLDFIFLKNGKGSWQ